MVKNGIKVNTGCRDCALCTGHALTGAGRNLGRGAANFATFGIAAAARKTCSICNHPMSEHEEWARKEITKRTPRWIDFGDGFRWYDGRAYTDYRAPYENAPPPLVGQGPTWFNIGTDLFQFWTGWEWKAWYVDHPNAEFPDADAPDSAPPGWYPDGTRYRYWSGRVWTNEWSDVERTGKPVASQQSQVIPPASKAVASADEVMRFAEMHRAGILSDEEFAAVKARLLGL